MQTWTKTGENTHILPLKVHALRHTYIRTYIHLYTHLELLAPMGLINHTTSYNLNY